MAMHKGEGFGADKCCETQHSPCKIILFSRHGFKLTWRACYMMNIQHKSELNVWETPQDSGAVVWLLPSYATGWTSHEKCFKARVKVTSIKRKILKNPNIMKSTNVKKPQPNIGKLLIKNFFVWILCLLKTVSFKVLVSFVFKTYFLSSIACFS